MKRAFIPKALGSGAFSMFDYSQIEPRTFAFFVKRALGDDTIAGWYREGRDVYIEIAARALKKPPEEVTAEERQHGKVWFLMSLYGAGPRKVSAELGIPYEEARQFYLDFHEGLPQIKALSNPRPKDPRHLKHWEPGAVERIYMKRGYLKTPWGRHLHAEKFGEHKLLNKLIQGTAAEIIKEANILAYDWTVEAGTRSHLVLNIHDELLLDGPEDELALLHAHIPGLMQEATRAPNGDFIHEVVPIVVDHEVALTNWAEKITYEEWLDQNRLRAA